LHAAAGCTVLQPDEPVPNAQLTEASIAEIVEAFKAKAGPANAERLAALLTSIHHLQHKQQQPAEGPSASPAAAAAGGGGGGGSSGNAQEQEPEVPVAYLLPIKDKDVRKVRSLLCQHNGVGYADDGQLRSDQVVPKPSDNPPAGSAT
jgi:hypothetical protein